MVAFASSQTKQLLGYNAASAAENPQFFLPLPTVTDPGIDNRDKVQARWWPGTEPPHDDFPWRRSDNLQPE